MSVIRTRYPDSPELGKKVLLPRRSPDLWNTLERDWAGTDPDRWQRLSMLHLFVHCHWTLNMLEHLYGQPKGQISRTLRNVRKELADRFRPEPEDADEQNPNTPD
jgi:hypothetical protein